MNPNYAQQVKAKIEENVATDLQSEEEACLVIPLMEFEDVFTWKYTDMRDVPPEVVTHSIPI